MSFKLALTFLHSHFLSMPAPTLSPYHGRVNHSVTRLGDLSHFGQLFKSCGNNYFAQIAHILGNLLMVSKYFIFVVKSFLGNLYRYLATLLLVTLLTLTYMIIEGKNHHQQHFHFVCETWKLWKRGMTLNQFYNQAPHSRKLQARNHVFCNLHSKLDRYVNYTVS